MTFAELLKKDLFLLPKISKSNTYSNNLQIVFLEYLELISQITDLNKIKNISKHTQIDKVLNTQKIFIEGILSTLKGYYDGNPSNAYNILSSTIEKRIKLNKRMIRFGTYPVNENFYRMRLKDDYFPYSQKEMFHIPFELRGKVPSQRFSIPGFPSLYMSRTLYVSWEEMCRPNINSFQVSKLTSLKNIQYLDLTPPDLFNEIYSLEIYAYVMIWPLIAACSFKVGNPNDVFKPEYIVPQLLLQWIRNQNQLDGIKYNSTHILLKKLDTIGEYGNLVLPVKSNANSGICEKLLSYFKISDPVSWHLMQLTNGGGHSYLYYSNEFKYIDDKLPEFEIINNKKMPYSNSFLGSMEYFLDSLDHKKDTRWQTYIKS